MDEIAILALEKDLFFSVRMRDTLRHHGMEVITARKLAIFEERLAAEEKRPALVIVHIGVEGIDWEAAIRSARTHGYPVLAFGSHMDLEARQRALEAGAQKVVANSKFSSDMPGLVKRMMDNPTAVVAAATTDEEE